MDKERLCPRSANASVVSRGDPRALRRYRCKACGKRFRTLTDTTLSCLHHKECYLSFGEATAKGETIVESAERCVIALSTAHRWRHYLLNAQRQTSDRLRGVVGADETFALKSRKEEWKLDCRLRQRGGTRNPPRNHQPQRARSCVCGACNSDRQRATTDKSRTSSNASIALSPSITTVNCSGVILLNFPTVHPRKPAWTPPR